MIEQARHIPGGTALECDLCIIGAGPAGITIARELAATGQRILLLVGGERHERAADRELFRGFASPEGSHEPLEENRRRMWGGSTSAWGGRCIPFDPVDFETRSWIPHSGWPFDSAILAPFFARANALCEAGEYRFDARETFPDGPREIIPGFDNEEVVSWPLERWGPPTHFGRRYESELRAAENVTVLFGAHATHLQLDPLGHALRHVSVASEPGHAFTIRARHVVLACGGLENARLLLASNDVARAGIGNHADRLGRFYMSHLFGSFAWAELRDPEQLVYDFERDHDGVYCRRRWWITPEAQRAGGIGNAIFFFFRPTLSQSQHRDALFSATYLTKFLLGTLRRRSPREALARLRKYRLVLLDHLRIVLADAPRLVPQIARIVRQRWFQKRRLPFVLPPQRHNHFYLYYQTEHAPNPESRVVLHTERDAFGMPRLEARVSFTDLDVETVLSAHRIMQRRFAASGAGELHYDEAALRAKLADDIAHFNSSAHQIGLTRMSRDPAAGVVDPDGRVHGVENLFVTGTSVFPTSGHANPTLTLVALAVRLADHLKTVMAAPPC